MRKAGLPPSARERVEDEQTMDDMLKEFTLPLAEQKNFEHSPTRQNTKRLFTKVS